MIVDICTNIADISQKTLLKAQRTQGIEYFDSFNTFSSKQKLQQALKSWSNFRLVCSAKEEIHRLLFCSDINNMSLLCCSGINNIAVKTDNSWLGKERLRESSHARVTPIKSQQESHNEEWRRQGNDPTCVR